jgi:hypothetical protein
MAAGIGGIKMSMSMAAGVSSANGGSQCGVAASVMANNIVMKANKPAYLALIVMKTQWRLASMA